MSTQNLTPRAAGRSPRAPGASPPSTVQVTDVRRRRRHPAPRTRRAITRWTARMIRRGVAILAVAAAGYMALEMVAFDRTYPNGIDAEQFVIFSDNPASRMLQGVPYGLDSAAAFAVWDGGWVLSLIVGTWALLVVTRLLRGEEESGRAELLLVGPLRSGRVTGIALLGVVAAALLIGIGAGAGLVAGGAQVGGSVVFGLALSGFALTIAGMAAVMSHIVEVRRRAAGLSAAVMGVAFLVRMVANSTDDRAWLGWFTPFGWLDRLHPFNDRSGLALTLLLVTPLVLLAVAVGLRERRDTGGAFLASTDHREARLRGLGGPLAYAWRSNRAVLLGWIVGLGAYALMLGSILTTTIDFLETDRDYRRLMSDLGLEEALTAEGFIGVMAVTLGVGFALYAAWRVGAARTEEETERADNFLARPVTRTRWLLGHVLLTVASATILVLATGTLLWLGVAATGSEDLSLGAALGSVLNTGSVVLLVTGVATLAFGVLPRLTTVVPVTLTVAGYVLTMLGPPLSWPDWVVNLSPFTHLAYVPQEDLAVTSAAVMISIGAVAAVLGALAFRRRDLAGA